MMKKIKNMFRLPGSMLAMAIALYSCNNSNVIQDYTVYQKGDRFVVSGVIDGKTKLRSGDASEAINAAIEMLEPEIGGEITVRPGNYTIESPLVLKDFVTLKGSGKSTVLKLGDSNEEGMVIFGKDVDNVVVSDMVLQGLPFEIELPDSTKNVKKPYVEEVYDPNVEFVYPNYPAGVVFHQVGTGQVKSVYARDFEGYGIWLRKDNYMCEVSSCITSGNGRAGVFLQHNNEGGRGGNHVPNIVIGCRSYGEEGHAYELSRTTCNNLVGNIVYQCKGHGFYLHSHSCSNLISGNRVFEGHRSAVYAKSAHETNVSSNIFCWTRENVIEFETVCWGTISGNNIIDAGGVVNYETDDWEDGLAYGVKLHTDTRSVQVTGNCVFTWGDGHAPMISGIYEHHDCMNNNIANNSINFYADKAVDINGKGSREEGNLGRAKFYSRVWEGPFMPDEPNPSQLLVPFTDEALQRTFAKTRR